MRKLAVLLITLLGMALPALAAPGNQASLSDVISALETPFKAETAPGKAIQDFDGDFVQESRIASLDRVQKGQGRVNIKFMRFNPKQAPVALFRWEYDLPSNQEIVSDGRTLWVYLPENNQAIVSDVEASAQAGSGDPLTFLTGLGNLSRDFQIGWAEPNKDSEGNAVLELRPRKASPMIARMHVVVSKDAIGEFLKGGAGGKTLPILSSTVFDPNGNSTLIEFRQVRVNRGTPESFFLFSPPAGVEVVRPGAPGPAGY